MHLIWTLIVGFFVGLIAKFLMPGRDPGGFIITIFLASQARCSPDGSGRNSISTTRASLPASSHRCSAR